MKHLPWSLAVLLVGIAYIVWALYRSALKTDSQADGDASLSCEDGVHEWVRVHTLREGLHDRCYRCFARKPTA